MSLWPNKSLLIFFIITQLALVIFWALTSKKYINQVKLSTIKKLLYFITINFWLLLFTFQIILNPLIFHSIKTQLFEYVGILIYCVGIILAVISKINLGKSWGIPMFHFKDQKGIITTGIYKYTRNPIYLSEMLMLIGFELAIPSYLIILIPVNILINYKKAKKEETDLENIYGEDYLKYKNRTPLFF